MNSPTLETERDLDRSDASSVASSSMRWGAFVTWDGVLPLVIGAIPFVVKFLFPKGHILEVVSSLLVPMFAALLRCVLGTQQIRNICSGILPVARQVALAAA